MPPEDPERTASSSLSIRQLRSFLVVADELHFGRAAARLHVTQPALSQQIARLEAIVGARLLERDRVTLGLTPAGEQFRRDARLIVRSATRAIEHARSAAAGPAPITVCHALTIEWSLLPRLIEALAGGSGLDPVWVVRSGERIASDLAAGSCDIAVARHLEDGVPGVEQEVLIWEQPAVYAGRGSPLARRSAIRLSELAGHRVRMFRREVAPKQYDRWTADLVDAGVEIDTSVAYRFGAQVVAEVSQGEYVTLGQASARDIYPGMAVIPVTDGLAPLPITLAWRSDDDRTAVRQFIELARALTMPGGPLTGTPWRAEPAGASPERTS
jgi:DNA-binding transcriptional LysR family regulator